MLNTRSKNWWTLSLAFGVVLTNAASAHAQHYTRTDITENRPGVSSSGGVKTDQNLVNAWGLSRSSASPWWVSDNGTGLTTLYDSTGAAQPLVVTVPVPAGSTDNHSAPTGTVFNYTTAFNVRAGAPAVFLFVTEDGTIAGWNPTVNMTRAITVVNRSQVAEYKGVAIAQTANGPRLYATNFKSGKIEVFDGAFHQLALSTTAFQDSRLPQNYVPFNIQSIGGNLVVTFAHREPGEDDEDHGAGVGYVSVFNTAGQLILRLEHGSFLNAPWGIAEAPADFGFFAHRLLIGNFGDGTIDAFNAITGKFEGKLLTASGVPIKVPGLWALGFGNEASAGTPTTLFFSAGPSGENDGLLGRIRAVSTEGRGNSD